MIAQYLTFASLLYYALFHSFICSVTILTGQITCFVSLVTLSAVLLGGDSLGEHTQGVVAVVAVLVFIFGYSVGPGVTCWVILTELVPTAVRAKIYGLFVSVHWICTLLQGLLTLIAIDGIGGYKEGMDEDAQTQAQKRGVGRLYILFAFISLSGVMFAHFYIPETTGKSPEDRLLEEGTGGSSSTTETVVKLPHAANSRARETFADVL